MAYSDRTLKLLCTKSEGRCSLPKCRAKLTQGDTYIGEIAHIRARNKNGPRFDPKLSLKERNEYANLLVFCGTCHKRVDSELATFTTDLLQDIKDMQHRDGEMEITAAAVREAELLGQKHSRRSTVMAKAGDHGVALAIGGDNQGDIHVHLKPDKVKYRTGTIGSDPTMFLYVEYLFNKAIDYWKSAPNMAPGRLGTKLKKAFKLGTKRTRYDLPIASFNALCNYIQTELIVPSPVGKSNQRRGVKLFDSFEEYRATISG